MGAFFSTLYRVDTPLSPPRPLALWGGLKPHASIEMVFCYRGVDRLPPTPPGITARANRPPGLQAKWMNRDCNYLFLCLGLAHAPESRVWRAGQPHPISIIQPPTPLPSRGTKAFALNVAGNPWTPMTVFPACVCLFFSRLSLIFCFLTDFSWPKLRSALMMMRANCRLNILYPHTAIFLASTVHCSFSCNISYCSEGSFLSLHQLTVWQIFFGHLIKGRWPQNCPWALPPVAPLGEN